MTKKYSQKNYMIQALNIYTSYIFWAQEKFATTKLILAVMSQAAGCDGIFLNI